MAFPGTFQLKNNDPDDISDLLVKLVNKTEIVNKVTAIFSESLGLDKSLLTREATFD